jgi:signal transduction histidine kinase
MRRFRISFAIGTLVLLAPLLFLLYRALRSAALERQLGHRAVAERVFDEMERDLSRVLDGEEAQPIDGYGSAAPAEVWPFVLGRFEVDPDGTVRVAGPTDTDQRAAAADEVERLAGAVRPAGQPAPGLPRAAAQQLPGTTVDMAGAPGERVAALEQDQAMASKDVSAYGALRSLNKGAEERVARQKQQGLSSLRGAASLPAEIDEGQLDALEASPVDKPVRDAARQAVERPAMRGRLIDPRHLMLSRTAVRGREAYRQGVVLDVPALGDWLRQQAVGSDGLAANADLSFVPAAGASPAAAGDTVFVYQHRFAEPFDELSARLALRPLPGVGGVAYVYALGALLLAMTALGLAALYRMVSVAVGFAERRSNFVAAVSHELKTPLTAIRMYGEMLRDGMVSSDAKRDEYYRHITAESERLSRLINNVLEFSRLEQSRRELALVSGPLAPVVGEVAELLRPHVEGEGFDLRLEVAPELPAVRFERDALMQVLWNLVDNAVKYARDASPRRILLRGWQDGGGVHVAVRDHGPGVPPRHLGKIFEPFYRGERELTRRSKGTGLGLALVRGLVERMGARVHGRNLPDGGFEVEIVFRPTAA